MRANPSIVTQRANHRIVLFIWLLAAGLTSLVFLFQAHIGLNLADEGYLWYGSWRTSLGEMPRVDFRAYDAPRNYWVAWVSPLFGDGLLAFRASIAIFQMFALVFGMLILRRVIKSRWILGVSALLLTIWMYPAVKFFDHAISLAAVYFAVLILENPDRRRAFLGGFFVGLAGSFRRNHALYTFLALSGTLVSAHWSSPSRLRSSVAPFGAGVISGFFPVWLLIFARPAFAGAYLDSILLLFERGKTNQLIPIPWPWRVNLSGSFDLATLVRLGTSVGFIALFSIPVIALIWLWRTRHTPSGGRHVVLAAALVAIPYAHHASARSDLSHLCQAIHPSLVAVVALLSLAAGRWRRVWLFSGVALLLPLTLMAPLYVQPGVQHCLFPDHYAPLSVTGDEILIKNRQKHLITSLRTNIIEPGEPEDRIFFAPSLAGLYRIFELKAPVWDSYPIWPPSDREAQQMIKDLSRPEVSWAIISHSAISNRHFWDTHPRIWAYLRENLDETRVRRFPFRNRFTFFKRPDPTPSQ